MANRDETRIIAGDSVSFTGRIGTAIHACGRLVFVKMPDKSVVTADALDCRKVKVCAKCGAEATISGLVARDREFAARVVAHVNGVLYASDFVTKPLCEECAQ